MSVNAQISTNLRSKSFYIFSDTIYLDTLSIIPGSEFLNLNGKLILDSTFYTLDAASSVLFLNRDSLDKLDFIPTQLSISYRVFPLLFTKPYFHKEFKITENTGNPEENPFVFKFVSKPDDIFSWQGLNKTGSISRGVSFGNNQDLAVNSNLNLQLSGKLTENVNITAAISDDNIPIQPDGNTQLLQEFDQVYIKVFDEKNELVAGDFFLNKPAGYFMNFNKRAQGGSFSGKYLIPKENSKDHTVLVKGSGAVSKGKFARNIINGVEGNQGPYRLTGSENETFIIVLAGTEKVYVDGKLMERGQDYDYIVDYNTAEITFTANLLITQFSRIVVEFQYSDKNYARSLFYAGTEYHSNKVSYRINMYSEQDAKNQPLRQELDTAQRRLLSEIGDSLYLAVVPGIDSVPFSNDAVLYKKNDTLVNGILYSPVYIYSTNSDSARYKLSFSQVGINKGNYVQTKSTANGRVFKWVAPINGIPQGNYEPVILLITPKRRQMATFGSDIKWGKKGKIQFESAVSTNDVNTFSSKDNNDNTGYAFRFLAENAIPLDTNKKPLQFIFGGGLETVNENFEQIERFRSVEFERDWNVINLPLLKNQYIAKAYSGLEKKGKLLLKHEAATFISESEYSGLKNSSSVFLFHKGFEVKGNSSVLQSNGKVVSDFLRQNASVSQIIKSVRIGVYEEIERNMFSLKNSDTLLANSFRWNILKGFIETADTLDNRVGVSYQYREDLFPSNNQFKLASIADDINFEWAMNKNKNSRFKIKTTYRKLRITDSIISIAKPEETVLGRAEYHANVGKGLLAWGTYYEIGSGMELKKEFRFLEVQPGQGTHAWKDYNDNGIKELNEFEVAQFQDQANYIKIFTPTNQYERTYTNQFSQTIFIRPETKWGNKKGMKKFISRFSDKASYRIDRKTGNRNNMYNPLAENITDTNLVAMNTSFLNSFYFNRTSPIFGLDFTFQDNKGKTLLTNGYESKENTYYEGRSRWNFAGMFTLNSTYKTGNKSNLSEFFTNRNYAFAYNEIEPRFSYQPNTQFRLSVYYAYIQKINQPAYGAEKAFLNKAGAELRYIAVSKGSVIFNFNYIEINYNALPNTAIAYDMMEALQPGKNYTWGVMWQRNLSKNMQLNLTYNGRQSENTNTIHSGGVQVRAFF